MLPGIQRDNPDYFAVVIMNDILGGGGFTSRIMTACGPTRAWPMTPTQFLQGGVLLIPLTFTAVFSPSRARGLCGFNRLG